MHATEFISKDSEPAAVPVIVLFGSERTLKVDSLQRIPGCISSDDEETGEDISFSRLAGDDAQLTDVTDELLTISMFGDRRVVMIEDADDFVRDNRAGLEKYVASPARASLLILDVKSWPKNTRLAKAVKSIGMSIECNPLSGIVLLKWLQNQALERFGKTIDKDAAALMVNLAGDGLGILQQELGKLASLAGDAEAITSEDVQQAVGDWRTQTTWVMLDAVRDGNVGSAIESLDNLMSAGEPAQKIMGGISFVFRKFAEATELARQTRDVRAALTSAGVFPSAVGPGEAYLRRIGFDRATRILQLLANTDADLKGGSRLDLQRQLERLLVRLGG
jgi:DNA polymerase III subunit delta